MVHYFKFRLHVLNKLVPACKLFRAFSKENDCLPEPAGRDRKLQLPRAAITPARTMNPIGEGYLCGDERITPLNNSCPSSWDMPPGKGENVNLSLEESHKHHFLDPVSICTRPLNQDRDKKNQLEPRAYNTGHCHTPLHQSSSVLGACTTEQK